MEESPATAKEVSEKSDEVEDDRSRDSVAALQRSLGMSRETQNKELSNVSVPAAVTTREWLRPECASQLFREPSGKNVQLNTMDVKHTEDRDETNSKTVAASAMKANPLSEATAQSSEEVRQATTAEKSPTAQSGFGKNGANNGSDDGQRSRKMTPSGMEEESGQQESADDDLGPCRKKKGRKRPVLEWRRVTWNDYRVGLRVLISNRAPPTGLKFGEETHRYRFAKVTSRH